MKCSHEAIIYLCVNLEPQQQRLMTLLFLLLLVVFLCPCVDREAEASSFGAHCGVIDDKEE